MNNEDFIQYEEALELKNLGFDDTCLLSYINKELNFAQELYGDLDTNFLNSNTDTMFENEISAPLYQQAFRWFQKNYNLIGLVSYIDDGTGKFMSVIDKINEPIDYAMNAKNTYEEAQLECLKKLIKIVKNKTNDKP